jgi:precorrin-2/cobalt-factor-2 C20-methyltransferase
MERGAGVSGRLYGLGLGPGDPELLTLKAARILAAVPVVAYPALEDGDSFARSIAAAHLRPGIREIVMRVPMSTDPTVALAAYDKAAMEIAAALDAGDDVAVLCQGDPFFYGSFMYVHARLADRFAVEVVPGVTSLTAVAAAGGRPLVARNETLAVLPATLAEEALVGRLAEADAAAIVKLGRHLPKVRAVLARLGRDADAVYVERASLPQQRVAPLAEAPDDAPYFSMVLVPGRGRR